MRSLLFMLAAGALCLLSACGNKGPLYRPHPTTAPAAASTASAAPVPMTSPASAASTASDD